MLQHTMERKNLNSEDHLLSHLHSLVIHVIVRILQPLHRLSTKQQHACSRLREAWVYAMLRQS